MSVDMIRLCGASRRTAVPPPVARGAPAGTSILTALVVTGLLVSLVVGTSGCGGGEDDAAVTGPTWMSLAQAQQQAAEEGKRVAVVFYWTGAPAADLFLAESIPHRQVRGFYDRYVWVKVEMIQEKPTAQQFRIYVAPSTVILEPSGDEVARYEKFMDGPELADFLGQHVRR